MHRFEHELPPAGLWVRFASETFVRDGGRRLAGGHPFRLLRLSEQGAEHARGWRHGAPLGQGSSERALARRLLDAGLLRTIATTRSDLDGDIDVIVPVHDRPGELERCLAALAADGHRAVVVDDASLQAEEIAIVARRHGATLICLSPNQGPAAARNAGLRGTSRPLVAFVDQDVQVDSGWLGRLLPHFADPAVAIAAPRVLAAEDPNPGLMAGYESRNSSLDMGPHACDTSQGRWIPYVPSTAILARRAAVGAGFDESLRVGEDVDLCWRLGDAGWRIVYEPHATVRHAHRTQPVAFLRTRWAYGSSIGPLAKRHGKALAPLRANGLTLASIIAFLIGAPTLGASLEALRAAQLHRHIKRDPLLLLRLAARDYRGTSLGLARAARRTWSPLLLAAGAHSRPARRALAVAVLLMLIDSDRPDVRDLPVALLDDLLAALALWSSCAQEGVLKPLVPSIS